MEAILLILLFVIGIYFGSFFTLATYRLPKHENITHERSYCPNCKHLLGIWDLIPVISYMALKGKCHYCGKPISIRYPLFEILSGIVFVLLGLSMDFFTSFYQWETIISFGFGVLYLASLFILAGIYKETNTIQTSVLWFGFIVATLDILYLYTFSTGNVYQYVIYLGMMVVLMILHTMFFRNHLHPHEGLQTIILVLYMLMMTGEQITLLTLFCTILMMGMYHILSSIRAHRNRVRVKSQKKKPVVFYLCVSNIVMWIGMNLICQWMR